MSANKNNKYKRLIEGSFNDADALKSNIAGLENYSEEEIKEIVRNYANQQFSRSGIDGVEIFDVFINGSRVRGNSREDSDLDVVIYYRGNYKDYVLFNVLNDNEFEDENLFIEDIRVDINPKKVSDHDEIARREIAFSIHQSQEYEHIKIEQNKS